MVVDDVFITRVVATILTAERTFWTQVTLVGLDFTSLMRMRTEQALNFSKQATLKLFVRLWIQVQVLAKMSQLSCPLTTFLSVRTEYQKPIQ